MLQGHVNYEQKIQNIEEMAWPHMWCFRFRVILILCYTQVDSQQHTHVTFSVPAWCLSSFTLCFILVGKVQHPKQLDIFFSIFHSFFSFTPLHHNFTSFTSPGFSLLLKVPFIFSQTPLLPFLRVFSPFWLFFISCFTMWNLINTYNLSVVMPVATLKVVAVCGGKTDQGEARSKCRSNKTTGFC